jgi:hypothetical protein
VPCAPRKALGYVDADVAALPAEGAARYGDMLREFNRRAYDRERHGSPPEVVARAVREALTARRPRPRTVVGKDARLLAALPRLLPARWLDRLRLHLFGLPVGAPRRLVSRSGPGPLHHREWHRRGLRCEPGCCSGWRRVSAALA